MKPLIAVLFICVVKQSVSLDAKEDGELVIDGTTNTIALTSSNYFAGNIDEGFSFVSDTIINVLSPSTPEEDIDYFSLIEDNVKEVVGEYVNQHNMDQIEVYKDDLATLMRRYNEAPVASDTYPDKNTMANSLSTSIVANRFLIEAVEWPYSMMLHYADISSIHIMVLYDAAVTYTTPGEVPSYWWVDLDNELEHYIDYGRYLQDTVVDWRNDLVTCSFDGCVKRNDEKQSKGVCYDVWKIVDLVAELEDECRVVSGEGDTSCDDHCQVYQIQMNKEVTAVVFYYLGRVIQQWEDLKLLSATMAGEVTSGSM